MPALIQKFNEISFALIYLKENECLVHVIVCVCVDSKYSIFQQGDHYNLLKFLTIVYNEAGSPTPYKGSMTRKVYKCTHTYNLE